VFNYDKRIYKINLSADSGITDFYKDVDLGFVLDVSNSMNFPSSLAALKSGNSDYQIRLTPTNLDTARSRYSTYYNKEHCFYIISDPSVTSTIYKVFKESDGWKYQDASSSNNTKYPISDNTVLPKDAIIQNYTLYYADDTKKRFDYLKENVNYLISTLNKIVTPTEVVDDETASVRIAYNLFADYITQSDTFTDLRTRGDSLYTLTWSDTDSGTRQNIALYDGNHTISEYSANEFGWDNTKDIYGNYL